MARPEECYRCGGPTCGFVYDPERGDKKGKIPKGTPFSEVPDDWKCPVCGASKNSFCCMEASISAK
ncbi:rubredoxin [Desulfosoma sp.]|uniref:rubredoxin n=1 Tax=Desulfosoma sp. TaxID=2603217 RepID=UPI00404B4576